MLRYTQGNIFDAPTQAIVNTVNTEGVMGKGLALQFKERYPENYKAYRKACKENKVAVGHMFITMHNTLQENKIIINFPTKTTWRKPSEYTYIIDGLKDLKQQIANYKIKSIAIPPLGTHNGGLQWDKVKQIIENTLADVDCDIHIYIPTTEIQEKLKAERVKLTPARAMMLDVLCDMVLYGEFVSVFAAEKVVYFLQRFGASNQFKIQFQPYYYGPYSNGKIAHVLYYLNGSYISGMTGMQLKPFDEINLIQDTSKTVSSFLQLPENKQYKEIADNTKQFLQDFYSSYSLELLSTIDYLVANNQKLKDWRSIDNETLIPMLKVEIEKWSYCKKQLFANSRHLPIVIDHLRNYL
jgi:O-acetyl-ADP-ribose deacetylase (regulator of RNase III)